MTVDVVNSQNKKVGTLELSDEVFGGRVKTDLIWEVGGARQTPPSAAARTRPRPARGSAAAARSRGGRRAPAARASARSATRCGARAAPCSGRSPAATTTSCRRRSRRARCARRWRRSCRTARLMSSTRWRRRGEDQGGRRAAEERSASTARRCSSTCSLDEKLALSVRNIAGVSLVPSNRVTARDVDGHAPRSSLTQAALERLQEALAMKLTDVIRRPLVTEKTTILREDGKTVVFEVATRRQQDRDQARGREAARRQGRRRAHGDHPRQAEAPGPLRRAPLGLEEGLRHAAGRREDCRSSWKGQ